MPMLKHVDGNTVLIFFLLLLFCKDLPHVKCKGLAFMLWHKYLCKCAPSDMEMMYKSTYIPLSRNIVRTLKMGFFQNISYECKLSIETPRCESFSISMHDEVFWGKPAALFKSMQVSRNSSAKAYAALRNRFLCGSSHIKRQEGEDECVNIFTSNLHSVIKARAPE